MYAKFITRRQALKSVLLVRLLCGSTLASMMEQTAQEALNPIVVFSDRADHVEGHTDGVNVDRDMYQNYREQNVVVTNTGVVVTICQAGNKIRWPERSGQDLVVKTSTDSGKTWSQGKVIVEHGPYSVVPNASVYDAKTDTIHTLYNLYLWDFKLGRGGPKSVIGRPQCKQYHLRSRDNGKTWSKPRDISDVFAKAGAKGIGVVFGSGEGHQLTRGPHAGRLVVPGGIRSDWGNRAFYSDDHGRTWQIGQNAPRGEGKNVRLEHKFTELADGWLLSNARCVPCRVRAWSSDGGITWTQQEVDKGLPTVSCNGCVLAVTDLASSREVVLCSVPIGPKRINGTLYLSYDRGKTWPVSKVVVPEKYFAYSSLVQLPDGHIGLFYEADHYRAIHLLRFTLDWLTGAKESDKN